MMLVGFFFTLTEGTFNRVIMLLEQKLHCKFCDRNNSRIVAAGCGSFLSSGSSVLFCSFVFYSVVILW